MKKLLFLFIVLFLMLGCRKNKESIVIRPTVYQDSISVFAVRTYRDSTFWNTVARLYSVIYNSKINYRFFNDVSGLLDSLDTSADVVLGIDKFYAAKLQNDTLFTQYRPINYQFIKRVIRPREKIVFIPFVYNYEVIFTKDYLKDYPKTLAVLQDHDLYNRVIYFNPDKTFVGRDFLLYSLAVYTNLGYRRFWRGIKKSVFSIEDDLQKGAEKFIKGDASAIMFPCVNPYIKDERYYLPAEGYFCSIFYMAIPKHSKNIGKSQKFIDFILSDDVQKAVYDSRLGIPVSTRVLEQIADDIKLDKRGKNLCNKPKPKVIRNNEKYMRRIWKRTIKKKKKK